MTMRAKWDMVASLQTADGTLTVFDPHYYQPHYPLPEHKCILTLRGQPGSVQVFLQRLRVGPDDWRNCAVKVLWSDAPETGRQKIDTISVESETLAIASAALLPERWSVGGQLNECTIYIDPMHRLETTIAAQRAAALLSDSGFSLRHEHDWLYYFSRPLSDTEMLQAGQLLKQASVHGHVNPVTHHSTGLITRQLDEYRAALLDDPGAPYLVAFQSGWGDGTYEWFALKNGETDIGFMSQMIEL